MRIILLAQMGGRGGRHMPQQQAKHRINELIRAKEIRVIDADGKMLGIMHPKDALKVAEEQELDLVEIAPQANPPVCKIIDYGKYLYEQQKREKLQRKQQQQQQLKEIRFKWRTDTHDFNFKSKHARNFLADGNKVKATVLFRGREIVHKEIGRELLERFIQELSDIAKLDSTIKMEGKFMTCILSPDKTVKK